METGAKAQTFVNCSECPIHNGINVVQQRRQTGFGIHLS